MDSQGSRVLERAKAVPENSSTTTLRQRPTPASPRSKQLQFVLRVGDGIGIFIGFAVPLLLVASYGPPSPAVAMLEACVLTIVGLWAMRFNGLWSPQVMAVRSTEVSHIFRALATLAALTLVLDRKSATNVRAINLVFAGAVALVVLLAWRSAFRAFLNAERRRGRYTSRVAFVGTGRQANQLSQLFVVHPELGLRVTAVIGAQQEAMASGLGHLWRGTYDDARTVLASIDVDVVVLCSAELDRWMLHDLSADAAARGRMLYVDPGLSGIDFKRVHSTAIGHQPLLEMSAPSLSGTQAIVKRGFDVAVSGFVAVLAAPVMLFAALLIKLEDGGPVLFRQRRVGRDGDEFEILKFRTMVVDAEAQLAALAADNERRGPLFKMDRDPRITRIGRFLRATSLDELPQLLNVLNGTMSLVGPRPALPSEVAEFPDELNARHRVRPGITGLWQVEARDNPSFEAYVRLDLFYVQNWTLALDLMILLGTIDHIVLRPIINALYRGEDDRRKLAASAPGAQHDDAVAVL
jgi:exopolysaccharide biosynthesis polyprenyl glycosylphosphotransferase